MSFFSKLFTKENKESLDQGLAKTKESFFGKITKAIAGKSTVDADVLDNLEEILISGDVGVNTTIKIITRIEERVKRDKYVSTSELNTTLREEIVNLLAENNSNDFTNFEYGISGKWLELLKEIAPSTTRVAVLRDANVASGIGQFAAVQAVAPIGMELSAIEGARPERTRYAARPRRRGDRVSAPGKAGAIQPVEVRPS